ncbi:MAG TPA: hypothetical protein VKE71_10030 [Candidatus Angelobacter sp.]|nr:hypothetical protein [Candidatus Angelobacter sp.]
MGDQERKLLFVQRDKVIVFQINKDGTGQGAQVGTATGKINGISIVNFKFKTTPGSKEFSFDDRAGITDPDGDQIIFRNPGTGTFICTPTAPLPPPPFSCNPALNDPTAPGTPPGGPFQVFGNGVGAALKGTYEVISTSGKYSREYKKGQVFQYRAVTYNPSVPPADPADLVVSPSGLVNFKGSLLGSVYVEVFAD